VAAPFPGSKDHRQRGKVPRSGLAPKSAAPTSARPARSEGPRTEDCSNSADPGVRRPASGRRDAGRPRRGFAGRHPDQAEERAGQAVQRLFEMEDVRLELTEEALRGIAHKAIARKTGARGLRSIMEATLLDSMFELPSLAGSARSSSIARWSRGGQSRSTSIPIAGAKIAPAISPRAARRHAHPEPVP